MDFNEQQKKAVYTIDRNISVSAGAGSGKTRVLVERFVYILQDSAMNPEREPVNAADIMAITFTKKAAGEMKERIREAILIKLNGKYDEAGNLEQAPDKERTAFWKQQLESLERAQINTIHSFCGRVLRENPVEAGIDPGFITLEDFDDKLFIVNGIKGFLRLQLKNGDADVKFLVDSYGISSLEQQLQDVYPHIVGYDFHKDVFSAYKESADKLEQKLEKLKDDLISFVAGKETYFTAKKKPKGYTYLQELEAALPDILADIDGCNPKDGSYDYIMSNFTASGSIKEQVKAIKALIAEINAMLFDKKALEGGYLDAWDNVLTALTVYLEQEKLKQDMLNFDDLENMAIRLLKNYPQVCRKYMRKFKHIMVDEFQDTNDKQRQLVYLLCGGDAEVLKGHKLFIVGDPKQSIYRFRNADVSVFARVRNDIARVNEALNIASQDEPGDLRMGNLSMDVNYRSSNMVLEACNAAFVKLLGTKDEAANGSVYFEGLGFGNKSKESELIPEMITVPYAKEQDSQKRVLEAQVMADKIIQLHQNGVRYGDMAVLVRVTTYNKFIADIFMERGIPYQIVDAKGFYEQQEILDVLNILNVLQNKHNSIQLAGVLRSPCFGLDDNTITGLFVDGSADNLWDNLQSADWKGLPAEQGQRLKRAAEVLASLRNTASFNSLSVLWEQLWQVLKLDVILARQLHGANRLANVRKLEEMSQEYILKHGGALGDWLSYVKRKRDMDADDRAVNLPLEDAVQIMTIHKSKGLEFNTVFVPFLDRTAKGDTSIIKYLPSKSSSIAKRAVFDENGNPLEPLLESGLGIKIPYGDDLVDTGVLKKLRQTDKTLEQEELLRLLYVAMTRAEERLFLISAVEDKKLAADNVCGSFNRRELSEKSWMEQLLAIFGGGKEEQEAAIKVVIQNDLQSGAVSQLAEAAVTVDDELAEFIAPLVNSKSSGRRHFTASNLQEYLHCPRSYYYEHILGLPMEEQESLGLGQNLPANITGLIVHTALEKYTDDADAAFNSAVNEHAAGQNAEKARELYYTYIASPLYRELAVCRQRERELEFALYEDNGLVLHGVIDSLGQNQDGSWSIIDYKTGRVPEPDELPLGYVYQLAIYKKAAERLWGYNVKECGLHYLQNLSEFKMPQDRDYFQEAVALCEKISNGADEKDFPCKIKYCGHCPYAYMCPGRDIYDAEEKQRMGDSK